MDVVNQTATFAKPEDVSFVKTQKACDTTTHHLKALVGMARHVHVYGSVNGGHITELPIINTQLASQLRGGQSWL